MNFFRLKRANWVVVMAMLALPGALTTSCSKQTDPTEAVDTKSNKLTISVLGVNEGNDADESNDANGGKAKASSRNTNAQAKQKVYEFSDVDMVVSLGNTFPTNTSNRKISGKSNGLNSSGLKAADSPLDDNIKYAIYIYDGSTLVASAGLAAGTAGTIESLDPAKSYTWVALSYSSETDAPSLTPTAGSINGLPANTDVLYATGTVDLATNNNIEIVFNHAFSRIGIELNTIGVFGNITGTPTISVSGLDLASGDINLLTGAITAGTANAVSLSYADFENVDPAHNDAKIAYLYTASDAAQNFQVTVQNLNIDHVDGQLARTYFATASPFNFAITPVLGNNHHALLNVVESALSTNYGGNEVKWGRSNLYSRGTNAGDGRDYAFYAENKQTSRGDGYFGFGGTTPLKFATQATLADPCALVYPTGLWRQPVKADFAGLVGTDIELDELTAALGPLGEIVDATGLTAVVNLLTNLVGNLIPTLTGINVVAPNSSLNPAGKPYTYGQYALATAPSGTNAFGNATSASNNLRFYFNGQISNLNVLQGISDGDGLLNVGLNDISADLAGVQIVNLNLPLLDSYGKVTALWTKDQGANILNLAGLGTWGYLGTAGGGVTYTTSTVLGVPIINLFSIQLADNFYVANNTGELLNGVNVVGLDVLGTSFKNVRCVRN